MTKPKPPSDIATAAKFTARFTTGTPFESTYLLDDLEEDFRGLVAEADPRIEEETGFKLASPTKVKIMTRSEWAAANVDSMLVLLNPLLEKMERRIARPVSGVLGLAYRPAIGAQMGAVLGFLSQRVLGQYDVISERSDEVWFIGANIVVMERRFGFVPRDFRLWVTLHELTHRAQFEANTWLEDHFLAGASELIQHLDLDARSLAERALKRITSGQGSNGPLGMSLLNQEQKKQFDALQALMSVIEGHANFVMDRAAIDMISTADRMRSTLRGAVPIGVLARAIGKLLGLDMKKRQYEEGQAFFERVFEAAGREGTAAVFSSAEMLPSLEEVRSPERWIARAGLAPTSRS